MTAPTLENPLGSRASGSSVSLSNGSLTAGDLWVAWLSISTQTINDLDQFSILYEEAVASTRRIYILATTDFSSASIGFTGSANYGIAHGCVRGCRVADPLSGSPDVQSDTSGGTVTAPAITTDEADTLVVRSFHKMATASGYTFGTPSGMSLVYQHAGTGSAGHGVALATKTVASAGTDAAASSAMTGESANPWGGSVIGFAPEGIVLPAGQFFPFF